MRNADDLSAELLHIILLQAYNCVLMKLLFSLMKLLSRPLVTGPSALVAHCACREPEMAFGCKVGHSRKLRVR